MTAISAPLDPEPLDDPEDAGVPVDRLDALVERARQMVEGSEQALESGQVAVARGGRLVRQVTFGDASPVARFNVFSVTKAFIAAAVWQLMGDGLVDPSDLVVDHVPEFGSNGKDVVTVEHLLTHTGGFPTAPLGPPEWSSRQGRLDRFAQWRLNWEPGSRMEYHPSSAHWVVAEIIERVTGRDFRDVVYEDVMAPLGLPRLRVGATDRHPDGWADVPPIRIVGEAPAPSELEELMGFAIDLSEVTDAAVLRFSEAEVRDLGVPGGGGIGSAGDVALFYQALLHNAGDLWDPGILADGTGRIRCDQPDPMLGVAANRSLGLTIAGDDGNARRRGFGKTVSARAFGHLGKGAQVAWADPHTGISFCFLTNDHDVDLLAEGMRINSLNNRAGALVHP
ncbi:MAG TPA: serine hydrolase domain-containing protein [Acidimicrobiales bacterium]